MVLTHFLIDKGKFETGANLVPSCLEAEPYFQTALIEYAQILVVFHFWPEDLRFQF